MDWAVTRFLTGTCQLRDLCLELEWSSQTFLNRTVHDTFFVHTRHTTLLKNAVVWWDTCGSFCDVLLINICSNRMTLYSSYYATSIIWWFFHFFKESQQVVPGLQGLFQNTHATYGQQNCLHFASGQTIKELVPGFKSWSLLTPQSSAVTAWPVRRTHLYNLLRLLHCPSILSLL